MIMQRMDEESTEMVVEDGTRHVKLGSKGITRLRGY